MKHDRLGNLLWSQVYTGVVGQAFYLEVDEQDDLYLFGEGYEDFSKRWLTM